MGTGNPFIGVDGTRTVYIMSELTAVFKISLICLLIVEENSNSWEVLLTLSTAVSGGDDAMSLSYVLLALRERFPMGRLFNFINSSLIMS